MPTGNIAITSCDSEASAPQAHDAGLFFAVGFRHLDVTRIAAARQRTTYRPLMSQPLHEVRPLRLRYQLSQYRSIESLDGYKKARTMADYLFAEESRSRVES
ncbi:hypothetical protein MUA04_03050 [Enterobacteriaceae bacterium H11S18]|uniref:hypothetical protein n=1 Tax=Dryocola clanedunensis TaxID=2925396 RepID=UPI0022F0C560|nr:hypothetical protein [Dryocola clanedunensis]MCT4709177.1 hypothetical protein [Dryocola clanedunensis]